jgi:CRISPR type III-A-associated protein Csm2
MADIQSVLEAIRRKETMSELQPEEFAEEGQLADQVAGHFGKDDLKPTQLRKVFHTLKRMQQGVKGKKADDPFDRTELLKLIPELAYATGRGLLPQKFYELLRLCLSSEKVKTNADFLRAFDFVEAILAYHKFRSELDKPKGGDR